MEVAERIRKRRRAVSASEGIGGWRINGPGKCLKFRETSVLRIWRGAQLKWKEERML